MRNTRVNFRDVTLMALLLTTVGPGVSTAAPRTNPADMAVPMPAAPQAPPAHVEPESTAPGMRLPVPSNPSSGGLPEAGESGNNTVQIRKLRDDADQDSRANAPGQTAVATPHFENGVRWLCGGVGQEESTRMKREARNYALMLSFSARDGSYLANVEVRVVDKRDRPVLEATCDGPILLLDPAGAGAYRITARSSGTTLTRTATIAAGQHGKSVAMVWPDRPSSSDAEVESPARR
jgi:hypothetical protein